MIPKTSFKFLKKDPWFSNSNSIWLFSTLKLCRNLKTHLFPHKLSDHALHDLSEMLLNLLKKSSLIPHLESHQAKLLSSEDKQLLYEHFLPSSNFSSIRNGEIFLNTPSGLLLGTLNVQDHIHLHLIDVPGHLEKSWNQLLKIENKLSKDITFAYSSKFGFLTSNFHYCGTGLQIQSFLHLPALTQLNLLNEHLNQLNKNQINLSSLSGSTTCPLGHLIIVSNRQTCGVSEEHLLTQVRKTVLQLTLAEEKIRQQMNPKQTSILKIEISKAFGILKHTYKISTQDALNLISLCKLGIELKWIQGITINEINTIFFSVRKGYLNRYTPNSSEEVDRLRASYIQEKCKKMKSKIEKK